MTSTNPTMPTLLMQAARSAAIADGLVVGSPIPPSGNEKAIPSKKPQSNHGDTVAAALAMVAAGNGGTSGTGSANNVMNPPSRNIQVNNVDMNGNSGSTNGSISRGSQPPSSASSSSVHKPNLSPSLNSRGSTPVNLQMQTMNRQSIAPSQLRQKSSFPAQRVSIFNPTSAGSAAHRRAVAASSAPQQMVAPVPKQAVPPTSITSHMPQSAPTPTSRGGSAGSSGGKKKGPSLRRGKWTPEEEAYANRLIMEFKAGLLPLTDGTTLRTFLSKLLNCDPMRISKKFVGSNCIGKQVFRRRTADINRLTTEQIQQSRAELSELERRFLERVAQTNRVKSSGVNNSSSGGNTTAAPSAAAPSKLRVDDLESGSGATPPWLRPPNGFKHGTGAATAAAALSSGPNRAAMAGRALLQGNSGLGHKPLGGLSKTNSAGLMALMEFQQRQNRQNILSNSASNLLAAAAQAENGTGNSSSMNGDTLSQLSRSVSAAKMAGLTSGGSMANLMLKTGISRDQLSQLVRDHRNSSNSLNNMMERQSSLDALMSLDFQSLQSIDNLANLIQTGRGSQVPRSGLKNWSSDNTSSMNNIAAVAASIGNSNGNVSSLADARRLQSEGRMENLIRSLSSGNVAGRAQHSGESNANFNNILQSMQNNLGGGSSSNNLLCSASALNLANMLRVDSSTGLTALRMQDGLAPRNSSVDDFLSLVASGDIPHQDPHLLNVPLQSILQQQQNNQTAAAQFLAQQQLLAQATNGGGGNSLSQHIASLSGLTNHNGGIANSSSNAILGERIASLGGLANHNSAASLLSQYASQQGSNSIAATALAHQNNTEAQGETGTKRKFSDGVSHGGEEQGASKR